MESECVVVVLGIARVLETGVFWLLNFMMVEVKSDECMTSINSAWDQILIYLTVFYISQFTQFSEDQKTLDFAKANSLSDILV